MSRRPSWSPRRGSCASRALALCTWLALALGAAGAAHAQRVVTLTGDPWPPFAEGVLGQEATGGIAVELSRLIFAEIDGVDASFPLIPWKRALREVETGAMDGIVLLLKNPERERYMVFTEPLFSIATLVWYSRVHRPDGFEWNDLADLRAVRVGVTRGHHYSGPVGSAIDDGTLRVTAAPKAENLFAMLVGNRLDVALSNESVGYALTRRFPDHAIVPAERPTSIAVYHLGLSRKSGGAELVPRINEVLARLKRDGTVDRLLRRP